MSTGLNNFSGGVLLSSGSLYLDQSSYTNNNGAFYSPVGTGTLTIDGGNINSGNGAITITNTVIINTLSPHIDPNVKFTNIQYAQLPGAINVASGTSVTIGTTANSSLLTLSTSPINVSSGGLLTVLTNQTHADRTLLTTSSLSNSGTINLGGNDMIIHNGSIGAITAMVKSGYNISGTLWEGTGIQSLWAASYTTHYFSLGVIQNSVDDWPATMLRG